jgi:hypothetical protein
MARKDPKAALAWTESLQGNGSRAGARNAVYSEWAARDPLAAFAACQEDGSAGAQLSCQPLGRHLAELPLEAVLPVAVSAPHAQAIRIWMLEWSEREPAALAGALLQLPDSTARQDLFKSAAERWRMTGASETREAMRHILEQEPAGVVRLSVSKALVESSAYAGDVEGAFALLEKEIPAAQREDSFRRLGSALLGRDPAAYAAIMDRIPVESRPPRQNLLQVWNDHDPAAAKAWETAHPQ